MTATVCADEPFRTVTAMIKPIATTKVDVSHIDLWWVALATSLLSKTKPGAFVGFKRCPRVKYINFPPCVARMYRSIEAIMGELRKPS